MADPVFNGSPMVLTDTEELKGDNSLPDAGAINLGAINSDAAVSASHGRIAGAKGVDAKIIHGNLWEDIDGNQGTVITGTETHNTMGSMLRTYIDHNELRTIGGKQDISVTKDATFFVSSQGSYFESMQGPVNRLYVQTVLDVYQTDHDVNEPESRLEMRFYSNQLVAGTNVNIVTGLEFELVNLHTEIGMLHQELKVSHPEIKVFNAYSGVLQQKPILSQQKIDALEGKLGVAAQLLASVNALTSFGLGTPFR